MAQVAAEAAVHEDEVWKVRTGEDVAAIARKLTHGQPPRLEVEIPPEQLRRAPWATVARSWEGELVLEFPRDTRTPCDDLLTPLSGKRSQLVEFRGDIAEAVSVTILSSVAAPAAALWVRLLTPLSLSALKERCEWLDVEVRPFEATDGSSRLPLPAQPFPWLRVTDIQGNAWSDVVHTVTTLAPDGKRYGSLVLESCALNEDELNRTIAALQRWGIRTPDSGPTCWVRRHKADDFVLHITGSLPEKLASLK